MCRLAAGRSWRTTCQTVKPPDKARLAVEACINERAMRPRPRTAPLPAWPVWWAGAGYTARWLLTEVLARRSTQAHAVRQHATRLGDQHRER